MKTIKLPERAPLTMNLGEALESRRSCREYSDRAIPDEVLSALLFAGAGRTADDGLRTVPSTMSRRAVGLYVVRADGVWRYCDENHALEFVAAGDHRADTTGGQDFVAVAPVTFAIVYDVPKGEGMGIGHAWADAAFISENIYLAATSLGLGSVTRGWFDPDKAREALGLGKDDLPILMHTVGYAAR